LPRNVGDDDTRPAFFSSLAEALRRANHSHTSLLRLSLLTAEFTKVAMSASPHHHRQAQISLREVAACKATISSIRSRLHPNDANLQSNTAELLSSLAKADRSLEVSGALLAAYEAVKASLRDGHSTLEGIKRSRLAVARRSLLLNHLRMQAHDLPTAMQESVVAAPAILEKVDRAFENAMALSVRSPSAEIGPVERAWIENALNELDDAASRFAQEAADRSEIAEFHETWNNASEFAQSIALFSYETRLQINLMYSMSHHSATSPAETEEANAPANRPTGQQPEPEPDAQMEPRAEPERAPERSGPETARNASRRSSRRRSRHSRSVAIPAPPTASTSAAHRLPARDVDPRMQALSSAARLLRACPLTRRTAAQHRGDAVSVCRELKQDVSTIEAMIEARHPPYSIAHMARAVVRSKLGNIAALRKARRDLQQFELQADDGSVKNCVATLDDRIAALEIVEQRIDADEADALKLHSYPRAPHLQRLLDLNAVDNVSPLKLLPSEQDVVVEGQRRGMLFELEIELRPLINGDRPPALFLHVHTKEPTTIEGCFGLPFDKFAAAHVKTAKQRSLGSTWEKMQLNLDFEDEEARSVSETVVHRGRLNASLWNAIKARVGSPGTRAEAVRAPR
jgi:hypothetical protein